MRHYPLQYPGHTAIVAPQLFGTVEYYRMLSRFEAVCIDTALRYDKKFKSVHRFDIIDLPGRQTITVPVAKPKGITHWNQATVSDHGKWWISLPCALETAYSRSPFYQYYAPGVLEVLSEKAIGLPITELCLRAHALVAEMLMLECATAPEGDLDLRRADSVASHPSAVPYWQIGSRLHGFTPGLSVLDLLFNMGPEGALYLAK